MRLRATITVTFAVALGAAMPLRVGAAPITIVVSGSIDTIEENGLPIGGSLAVGTPYTVTVVLDPATAGADLYPDEPFYAEYPFAAPNRMRIEVGDYVFEAGSSGFLVKVHDGVNEDSIDFRMEQMQALGAQAPGEFALTQVTLYSTSTTRLSSDALPPIAVLDLALWEITSAGIGFEIPTPLANNDASGSIDSLVVAPEPGSFALALLGLTGAFALRRDRRQLQGELAPVAAFGQGKVPSTACRASRRASRSASSSPSSEELAPAANR